MTSDVKVDIFQPAPQILIKQASSLCSPNSAPPSSGHISKPIKKQMAAAAAAPTTIEGCRAGAEIHRGHTACLPKLAELLVELGLPNGLFPLDDIEEFGYNRAAGFMWVTQKKKKEHNFKKIKQLVSYAPEVTARVEKGKMKGISGVKTRELLIWITVTEMYVEDPSSGKVTFKTGTGLSDSFPADAFELNQ